MPVTIPDQSNAFNSNYPEVELNKFHKNNPNTGEQKKAKNHNKFLENGQESKVAQKNKQNKQMQKDSAKIKRIWNPTFSFIVLINKIL